MKRRIVAFLSVILIVALCVGCDDNKEVYKLKIGISMPSVEELTWNQEGNTMKNALSEAGYDVDLQFAGGDASVQAEQIQHMIESDCRIIVVAPVDAGSLVDILLPAKEKGIDIISYKDLILNSDAVSCFVTIDTSDIGYKQGQYIVDALELDVCPENRTYTLELFAGNAGDEVAQSYFYDAIEVLQPYIDSGVLTILSGAASYEAVVAKPADEVTGEPAVTSQKRMTELIDTYYDEEVILDAVYCVDDATALEVATAIEYNYVGNFPVITGYGCTLDSVRSITTGRQTMTVFADTGLMIVKTLEMIDAILNISEMPVNDTVSYNNGVKTVPAYVYETTCVDKSNYVEELIESGYYTESQLK